MAAAIQISHLKKSVRRDKKKKERECKTEKGLRVIGAFYTWRLLIRRSFLLSPSLVDEFMLLPLNPLNELNLKIPSFITTV